MRAPPLWLPMVIGALIPNAAALAADEGAKTPEQVRAAEALMKEVAGAYAAAPAMTDETALTFTMPGMGEQSLTCAMRFEGRNAEIKGLVDMFDLYVVDGTLYVTAGMSDDGAVRAELGDDPAAALAGALGDELAAFSPQLLLRLGAGADRVMSAMGHGLLQEPSIVGHQMIRTDEGASMHEVLIDGTAGGMMRLHVDPATKLIVKSIASGLPEDYPGTEPIVATTAYRPTVLPRLESPIAFDAGERKMHDTVDAMMAAATGGMPDINPTIEIGTEAPTFALLDQDGERHDLVSYRGQVVVLDWWGKW